MDNPDLKAVFDRVVAVSINKKNMKILNALNEVKKALNSREYTTTDRSYLKAVLFPEKSKGAKIPSIYPTSTNSFRQQTKFEIVVNDSGFFAVAMDVENTSNLYPVFYEFDRGLLEDWNSPRHLRFDGTQMSLPRDEDETTAPRISDRKDASIVFDTARIVGASLTATIQRKPEDVYGTMEGALDPTARFDPTEFAPGTSPEIVTAFLMSTYDALSLVSVKTPIGHDGFRVVINNAAEEAGFMRNLVYDPFVSGAVRLGNISVRTYVAHALGFTKDAQWDPVSRLLADGVSVNLRVLLDALSERVTMMHNIKKTNRGANARQIMNQRNTSLQGTNDLAVIASAELKLIEMLETIVVIAANEVGPLQLGGLDYTGNEFLMYCENLLAVAVQGITSRQRDFVKQRVAELVNVRTVSTTSGIFQSDRVRGLSFYSEAKASLGIRVLYVPTKANELVPIHEAKTGPRPFLFVFGHSIEKNTRIVIESSRVFETQTNMRYRDYIIPTKAVPDPRSLTIINYIHTTAKWILHVPPLILDGLYEEIRNSLGHFDMALASLGGKGSSTGGGNGITIKEIQERMQESENMEKIE